ncbi:MAG TPA: hypothetical protein ENI23_13180, partial [bacterium]|nr:hypothetical protein [bacterium]
MAEKKEKEIKELLRKFPFVNWDRFIGAREEYTFYGWIDREDSYRDFLVLNFTDPKKPWFCTSSNKYSKKIAAIL